MEKVALGNQKEHGLLLHPGFFHLKGQPLKGQNIFLLLWGDEQGHK